MQSVTESNWFGQELVRNTQELVETHINKGFTFAQYIDEKTTLVKFFVNIDIHLEQVPSGAMNWGMKNISGTVFDFIK